MFTAAFAKAALERALKTVAQTLAALLVASGTGLLDTDWGPGLSVAGMAGVISVLTSLASGTVGGDGPSLTHAETITPSKEH